MPTLMWHYFQSVPFTETISLYHRGPLLLFPSKERSSTETMLLEKPLSEKSSRGSWLEKWCHSRSQEIQSSHQLSARLSIGCRPLSRLSFSTSLFLGKSCSLFPLTLGYRVLNRSSSYPQQTIRYHLSSKPFSRNLLFAISH